MPRKKKTAMKRSKKHCRHSSIVNSEDERENETQNDGNSGHPSSTSQHTNSVTLATATVSDLPAIASEDMPSTSQRNYEEIRLEIKKCETGKSKSQTNEVSCSSSSTTVMSIPEEPSNFSPNTELLVSNIDMNVTDLASSATNVSVPSTSESQGAIADLEQQSRTATSHSEAQNTNRTISLRSRTRRGGSQSRAIMSAYRSIPSSLPVKGESYCDCPKTSRDLTCSCGEEDTGENI